jgi:ABC-type branched-subunit amino acid transport system ATPase component
MTAEENVMVCLPSMRSVTLTRAFFQSRKRTVEDLRRDAHRALEKVGGLSLATSSVDDLSYGDQKLVAVARTIAAEVQVILFDEPFAGLDEDGVRRLSEVIRELAQEGRTVGIIDHNVDAMVRLVDFMYVMNFGEVIASGSPTEVMSNSDVRAAYLGRD